MSETATWFTLATVILGFLFQMIREQRNRRWDLEDRKDMALQEKLEREKVADRLMTVALTEARRVADLVIQKAAEVAATAKLEAAAVASVATAAAAKLASDLQANTQISTQAFKEANSVNLKIQALGLEHNALQRERQEAQKKEQADSPSPAYGPGADDRGYP